MHESCARTRPDLLSNRGIEFSKLNCNMDINILTRSGVRHIDITILTRSVVGVHGNHSTDCNTRDGEPDHCIARTLLLVKVGCVTPLAGRDRLGSTDRHRLDRNVLYVHRSSRITTVIHAAARSGSPSDCINMRYFKNHIKFENSFGGGGAATLLRVCILFTTSHLRPK